MDVEEDAPTSFEGIPVLNNQRSWFFRYGDKRGEGDIDKLWDVFVAAAALVESDQPEQREAFVAAYDAVIDVWGASWNISTGAILGSSLGVPDPRQQLARFFDWSAANAAPDNWAAEALQRRYLSQAR